MPDPHPQPAARSAPASRETTIAHVPTSEDDRPRAIDPTENELLRLAVLARHTAEIIFDQRHVVTSSILLAGIVTELSKMIDVCVGLVTPDRDDAAERGTETLEAMGRLHDKLFPDHRAQYEASL